MHKHRERLRHTAHHGGSKPETNTPEKPAPVSDKKENSEIKEKVKAATKKHKSSGLSLVPLTPIVPDVESEKEVKK